MSFFKKSHWENWEYEFPSQIISDKIINKAIDIFFEKKINDFDPEKQFLALMFRVRLSDTKQIRTLTKLQRVKLSNKEYIKTFLNIKKDLIQEEYENSPISSLIFSYGIRKLSKNATFLDSIREQLAIDKKPTFHIHRKTKLPFGVNLSLWGHIIKELPNFKIINLGYGRIVNIEILVREDGFTYYLGQLIYQGVVKFEWEDKILNFKKEEIIRKVGNTIFFFKGGQVINWSSFSKAKPITLIKTKNKINTKIIAGDLETVLNEHNQMVPYLGTIKGETTTFFSQNKNPHILFNDFFKKLFIRKNRNHHIYFHNLSGFDGIFLLKKLVDQGFDLVPTINGGKLISIEVKKPHRDRDVWTINDSFLILLSSIKSLANTFLKTESKGIFPYYLKDVEYKGSFPSYDYFDKFKTSPEEYNMLKDSFKDQIWDFQKEAIKYCSQDSKILYEILINFNNFIFNNYKIHLNDYPTIPSLAFAIFRTKYLKTSEVKQIVRRIRDTIKLSYTGGSTDMFLPEGGAIFVYDVNSLYPSVMEKYDMPIGDPEEIQFMVAEELTSEWNRFGFFEAEINVGDIMYPILQIHHNNRTISPIGSFTGWFFSEELKNALNFGYKISVTKGIQFKRMNIFKDFVNDQYNLRLQYPKSDPMNYIAKLLLNSLYGRFGMSDNLGFIEILTNDEFTNLIKSQTDIEEIISFGSKHLVKFKNIDSLDDELNNPFANVNIAIASAITAYARVEMSKYKHPDFLSKHNLILYYSDTDSLYFNNPLPNYLIDPKRLGALKFEGEYTKGVFLAPKVYVLENLEKGESVIKIKGLSKVAIKDNNLTIDKLNKLLFKDSSFKAIQEKWFRDIGEGTIKILEQTYDLKVTNNKRELIYDADGKLINTKPINLTPPKEG